MAAALILASASSSGCRQRSAQQVHAPTYTSASYVKNQNTSAQMPPVAANPAYRDVHIVQQQAESIPGVPNSVGQESLSTGERVTVVTYVHHYAEPVESFPTIYWSGRSFYNVHGNFVFWDPFWNSWAYYWGPPHPLIMAWNIQYPWVAFAWGRGFYGPGWYWGGVNAMGWHGLGQVAHPDVTPAPLPARPKQAVATNRPRPIPNPNSRPRPNYSPTGSAKHPGQLAPNANSVPRPNRAQVPNPRVRPRPNVGAVASKGNQPRVQGLSRPRQTIPSPARVVHESRQRPTYVQSNVRVNGQGQRPSQVRVYRPTPRPMYHPGARPNVSSSRARAAYSGRSQHSYSSSPRMNYRSPRPNYSSAPRPNYSSSPRMNHSRSPSRSHATSHQRVQGISRSNPR